MNKSLLAIPFALALIFLTNYGNVSATNIDQGSAGGEVTITIDTTLIPGSSDVHFTPSPQINMSGASETTGCAINAAHELALGKANGRQFGMAADSSTVFWRDAPEGDYADLTNTNSAPFAASWNRN